MIFFWNDWKSLIRFSECVKLGVQLEYEIWLVYKALYGFLFYWWCKYILEATEILVWGLVFEKKWLFSLVYISYGA